MAKDIHIGKHRLRSRVLTAPMSGVTDLPFRRILQKFNPGLVISEMVASETLLKGDPETEARAAGTNEIDPLVIQLVGREPQWMYEGAKRAKMVGADIIDINMGCPARKVTTGLSGSALMRDIPRAINIIEAVLEATSLPVTLKMRLGWDRETLNAASLAQQAEACGIKMLVVHGRTRCEFYKGEADWAAIKPVKDSVNIPVFANGDIDTPDDAVKALELSLCDGVMVGRSLIGAPWKLQTIMQAVDGPLISPAIYQNPCHIALEHYADILAFYPLKKAIRVARKHLAGYADQARGLSAPERAEIKSRLCRSDEPDEVIALLKSLFRDTHIEDTQDSPDKPSGEKAA